jgi:hypothetical protein
MMRCKVRRLGTYPDDFPSTVAPPAALTGPSFVLSDYHEESSIYENRAIVEIGSRTYTAFFEVANEELGKLFSGLVRVTDILECFSGILACDCL